MSNIEWTDSLAVEPGIAEDEALRECVAATESLGFEPPVEIASPLGAIARAAGRSNVSGRSPTALAGRKNMVPRVRCGHTAISAEIVESGKQVGLGLKGRRSADASRGRGARLLAMPISGVVAVVFALPLVAVVAAKAVDHIQLRNPSRAHPAPCRRIISSPRNALAPRRPDLGSFAASVANGHPAIGAVLVDAERANRLPVVAAVAPLLPKSAPRLVFRKSRARPLRGNLQNAKSRSHGSKFSPGSDCALLQRARCRVAAWPEDLRVREFPEVAHAK